MTSLIDVSEVKSFIQGKTFDEIKESAGAQGLRVRELSTQKALYLLIADNSENDTNPLHIQANGIILEKETNKIVCMCQNKFLPLSSPSEQIETLTKLYPKYSLEYCEDGTLIRLYNYGGTWMTSTTKCIDAKFSYWKQRDQTFDSMFWNLFKYNTADLNTDYTYVFVLISQDNRIVVNHASDSLIFVSKINNNDQIETSTEPSFDFRETEKIEANGNLKLDDHFNSDKRGLLIKFYDTDGKSILYKYDFKPYSRLKEVRGNVPLIRMRYLELLNNPSAIKMLEENYNEHTFLFQMAKHQLTNLYREIHQLYFDSHIKHAITVDDSHKFHRTLKQLHAQYKTTGRPITLEEVKNKVNTLDPNVLRQFLNWV